MPDDGVLDGAAQALAAARRMARDRGYRPGSPAARRRRIAGEAVLSGSGRDGRDPTLVGDTLDQLIADRGWHQDVALGSVLARWPELVGPDLAAHTAAVGFAESTLSVHADSTAWATQVRLLSTQILGRLAEAVGPGTVTELVVRGPAAPSWVRGRRRVAGRGPRDTYG